MCIIVELRDRQCIYSMLTCVLRLRMAARSNSLRTNTLAARAFQHRHAELGGALVAFGGQIGEVADAGELQLAVENAEHGVTREVDGAHVVFDDVVRHDLTEAQQAVVFAQCEKVRQQTFAVDSGEFTDQSRRTTGCLRQAIVRDDRLGGAG
jgi:hypothetical protein